jgi:hypothetical protein
MLAIEAKQVSKIYKGSSYAAKYIHCLAEMVQARPLL